MFKRKPRQNCRGFFIGCSAKGLGNAAAGLLDLRLGGGRAGDLHGELLRELAVAEDLDLRLLVVREARLRERLDRDLGAGFELLLEVRNIDGESLSIERGIVETALGQAANQRHLTTFEQQLMLMAFTGLLALLALARRLAHARAAAATDALPALAGARGVSKRIEFHDGNFLSSY